MRTDAQWTFVPAGAPFSLVGAAGANLPTNPLDMLGLGVGVAPTPGLIIGNVTLWGADFGIASGKMGTPKLQVSIGTGLVTATAATLNLALQFAPDNGAAGVPPYNPGAWQTVVETGALTAAQLPAGTVLARFDWPPVFPQTLRPRFARLLAQVPAATDFTAGTINFAGVVFDRDDQANKQAARNYSVS